MWILCTHVRAHNLDTVGYSHRRLSMGDTVDEFMRPLFICIYVCEISFI